MPKTKEEWLAESNYWDSLPLEELTKMSEPVDWKPMDARPKKAISLRLTESLIDRGKEVASELGIGYQTLFRMLIVEGLRRHKLQKLEESASRKRKSA